MQKWIHCIK